MFNMIQVSRLSLSVLLVLLQPHIDSAQRRGPKEVFKTELFLNENDLTAGLYEGEVRGRKRFGDTQEPHGFGTIFYFTADKFNRVNYTGRWIKGKRGGNGTTYFKDGAIYRGGYKTGLEEGPGFIRYPNGNTLDAEFKRGKIQGHGVFRYSNGDQREGFFKDSILEGQVIFTKKDGTTFIEQWKDGEQTESSEKGKVEQNLAVVDEQETDTSITYFQPGERTRGEKKANFFTNIVSQRSDNVGQQSRRRTRKFLFDIYKTVNS